MLSPVSLGEFCLQWISVKRTRQKFVRPSRSAFTSDLSVAGVATSVSWRLIRRLEIRIRLRVMDFLFEYYFQYSPSGWQSASVVKTSAPNCGASENSVDSTYLTENKRELHSVILTDALNGNTVTGPPSLRIGVTVRKWLMRGGPCRSESEI